MNRLNCKCFSHRRPSDAGSIQISSRMLAAHQCRGSFMGAIEQRASEREHDVAAPEQARDPVCGMLVDPATAKHRAQHEGVPYFFCNANCQAKFLSDPAKYLKPRAPASQQGVKAGVIYTCPMHPQIRQPAPGNCPICGMALEPEGAVAAYAGPSPELIDMRRRFRIGAALALPIV